MDEQEAEALYDRSREDTRQDNQEYCSICLLDSYWCRCEEEGRVISVEALEQICDMCQATATWKYGEGMGGDSVVLGYFCDDHSPADIRRLEQQEAENERFYGVDARLETFGDW